MAKRVITKRIGEVLLERGTLTREQLEAALTQQQAQGGLLGQVLIQLGFVTEEQIALALTAQYGFPYLPLDNYEIDDGITTLVPEQVARQYCLIPIDRIGKALTVAMSDPSNTEAVEDLELLTGCTVQTFVSTPSTILRAIDRYYKAGAAGSNGAAAPSAGA